jgi:release factor glutamine methyltransferase
MMLLSRAADRLRAAGIARPQAEARLLLAHAMDVPQEAIVAETAVPDAVAQTRFEDFIARRVGREPFAYIVETREFWSLDFSVGPGVLIPRPESETLIEQALKRFPDKAAPLRVLDLGTGSGCLLLAFLSERPCATGVGIDLSQSALGYARRNVARLGLAARAEFIEGNWPAAPQTSFDIIFANPPYIAAGEIATLEPDVAAYEPHLALDGGGDGLDAYRDIASVIAARLTPEGYAFVEIGYGQGKAVSEIFAASGLGFATLVSDLSSIARCVEARLDPAAQGTSPKKDVEMAVRSG